jgi:hypothetical protein
MREIFIMDFRLHLPLTVPRAEATEARLARMEEEWTTERA